MKEHKIIGQKNAQVNADKIQENIEAYRQYRDKVLEHVNYLNQWTNQLSAALKGLDKFNDQLPVKKIKLNEVA